MNNTNKNTTNDIHQPPTHFTTRLRYYNIEYDVKFVLNTRNNYNIIFQDYELKKHRKNANTSVNYRCKQGFKCSASVTIYKNQITHLVTKHNDLCVKQNELRNCDYNNNPNPNNYGYMMNHISNAIQNNNYNNNPNINTGNNAFQSYSNNFNSYPINPYQQFAYDLNMLHSFTNNFQHSIVNGAFQPNMNCFNSQIVNTRCYGTSDFDDCC